MRRPRWSSTLPKLAQITGPSSYHLAAPDLFRLWFVRWRRPQLRSGSGRVENVRYGLLVLALTTTTLGDLGATYDDHLRLIGKRVVDFLLVLIELFR